MRIDNRRPDEMRPVRITTNYLMTAEGSVLIEVGHTRVLCAASVEETVPQFLRGSGRGWVTAEYSMLPRSTVTRTARESERGRIGGYPGGGGYAAYAFNVGYARAMMQAALTA